MFWEVYNNLCKEHRKAPTAVLVDLGLSKGSIAKWKEGAVPRGTTLLKIADYFGVTPDYLLGKEQKENTPAEDLSEGERMVVEALRVIPEEQRTAAMMECIALLMQRRQGS